VKVTSKWQYRTTVAGQPPTTFTESRAAITDKTFVAVLEFPDQKTESPWTCSSDGLLMQQIGTLTNSPGLKLAFSNAKGLTLPPAAQWKVGAQWAYGFEVKGQALTAENKMIEVVGRVDVDNVIASQEKVTVPASATAYDTFRVDGTFMLKLTSRDLPSPLDQTFKTSSWHASGIGIVKSATYLPGVTAVSELITYTP
jgi:TolB-like protein